MADPENDPRYLSEDEVVGRTISKECNWRGQRKFTIRYKIVAFRNLGHDSMGDIDSARRKYYTPGGINGNEVVILERMDDNSRAEPAGIRIVKWKKHWGDTMFTTKRFKLDPKEVAHD